MPLPQLAVLAVTSVLRHMLDGKPVLNLTEFLFQAVLLSHPDLSVIHILPIFGGFIALAYAETQAEYRNDRSDWERATSSEKLDESCRAARLGCWPSARDQTNTASQSLHGKAVIFPTILRHIRRSGFKDDFRHSYLYVGAPVGLKKAYPPLLSIEKSSWNTLFSVKPQPQGLRGGHNLSLSQKLEEILLSQNEDPNQWAYAYFLTAPNVTDFLNNPLAFWYLYDENRRLDTVILQLDTSYGERRMWLVRNEISEPSGKSPYDFRGRFVKDLQVSPFMPLDSQTSYIFESSDPCTERPLQLLVTLKQGSATLMVTSVSPLEPRQEVEQMSTASRMMFALRWWWVPLSAVVVFRILTKAAKIYMYNKKKLNISARAEPTATATAKPARTIEKHLEEYFFRIFRHAVSSQSSVRTVKYVSTGEHAPLSRVLVSGNANREVDPCEPTDPKLSTSANDSVCDVTFQVTTPVFYIRFFQYKSPLEAIKGEVLCDERARTATCTNTEALAHLFATHPYQQSSPSTWQWRLSCALRCPPFRNSYCSADAYTPFEGLSASDQWILNNCANSDKRRYRRALLRANIGQILGGVPEGFFISTDLELLGMSRDAVVRIHEAILKTALVVSGCLLQRVASEGHVAQLTSWWFPSALNIWACFKALV